MTTTIKATYANGVFKPKEPFPLVEGTEVELAVTTLAEDEDPLAGIIGICSTGRTDGAANHDKYICDKVRP